MNRFDRYMRQSRVQNIIAFSGGKDSTACYLLLLKWGVPFRAVFADTGHEHEWTLEYVATLHDKTGGPKIETIKADFSKRIAKKRLTIAEKWPLDGVPQDRIDRALELLHPTGIPFLDLCMLKGRFPSTKARFCTEELKVYPSQFQIIMPAMQRGPVCSIQGVRAQESERRRTMPVHEWDNFEGLASGAAIYRPIFHWTHEQVFALHREMNCPPNPLYKVGAARVGCMPCIMCQKGEIRIIGQRFPEHIDRVAEWEKLVSSVSKRGISTFFADDTAVKPEGYVSEEDGYYGIREVVAWSKTTRGGRQFDLMGTAEQPTCASKYGLCE